MARRPKKIDNEEVISPAELKKKHGLPEDIKQSDVDKLNLPSLDQEENEVLEELAERTHSKNTVALASLLEPPTEERLKWNPDGSIIPPLDYGYKADIPEGHYNVDIETEDGLFRRGKKTSRNTPMINVMTGSYRALYEAQLSNPSHLLSFEEDSDKEPETPDEASWQLSTILAISGTGMYNDQWRWLMNDTTRKWFNGIPINENKYRGLRRPKHTFDSAKISIKSATAVIKNSMNTGSDMDVFLPHSGIGVTIRPPSLSELIEFEKKIVEDRIHVGRRTRGLFGSNNLTYLYRAVWDCFIKCIKSTSLGELNQEALLNLISVQDIDLIAWLLASGKYPNGFLMAMPCFANPKNCNHITHELVDVRKLLVYDKSKLDSKQREYAGIFTRTVTAEEQDDYLERVTNKETHTSVKLITSDEDVEVEIAFHTPSLKTSFESAEVWINALENACNTAFEKPLYGEARERYIVEQQAATAALSFEHFVASISLINKDTGETVRVDTQDEVRELLVSLTEIPENYNIFLVGVLEYINYNRLYTIGVPNVKCPSCGGYHEAKDESGVGKRIIPFDPISVFSILCQQQIAPYLAKAEDHLKEKKTG